MMYANVIVKCDRKCSPDPEHLIFIGFPFGLQIHIAMSKFEYDQIPVMTPMLTNLNCDLDLDIYLFGHLQFAGGTSATGKAHQIRST